MGRQLSRRANAMSIIGWNAARNAAASAWSNVVATADAHQMYLDHFQQPAPHRRVDVPQIEHRHEWHRVQRRSDPSMRERGKLATVALRPLSSPTSTPDKVL
jgi:hypothetical protein